MILRPLLLTNEEIRSYLGATFLLRFLFAQKMKVLFESLLLLNPMLCLASLSKRQVGLLDFGVSATYEPTTKKYGYGL
jgi:hypothetical protein